MTIEIAAPKPDLDAKAKKKTILKHFERKIISAKIEKICSQITVAALMQPPQYYLRDPAAKETRMTHAAVEPSNLDAAITMRFAASRSKPARIYAHGNTRWQQSCSHSNAICNHRFKKRIELYAHWNNHSLKETQEEPIDLETIQTAPAARRRYLSPTAAATLHGKTQGFVLRLPPQNQTHATFMQPLQ